MSQVAAAVLAVALATGSSATPAAPAVPRPVAELPGPTQNCPGLPAASRVTHEPWAQRTLGFSAVWPLTRGQGVTVAVVDSGVDYSRQLAGRVTAIDLTGTGLRDCVGHGTEIAAIIAASDLQAQGMPFEGVAPAARILSVKVNSQETGSELLLAEGIRAAVLRGAQVINVSITSPSSPALRSAVEFALKSNVVVVAAGGNDGTTAGAGPFYPASYPGVLSVGAVDPSGALAPFSNQRSHVVVTAPGVDVTSAFPGGYQQDDLNGTSYATAFVSGVAALVRSRYPRLSARQVFARIEATADGGTGPGTGHGLVDPVEAVTAILPGGPARWPSPPATAPVSVSRALPPDRTARPALAVGGGSLGVAVLVALGALVFREGRRRRWRAGRAPDSASEGPAGGPWP
jgi:membrane-anchored mycosin MYCP